MIRSTPDDVFTSNAPPSSIPARHTGVPVPLDARADRTRRGRAPRLQDITGALVQRREPVRTTRQDRREQRVAIDRPAQLALDRRRARRDLRRIGRRLHVDADADHDGLIARADREALGEDAGQLAPADQQVVRPFQIGAQSGAAAMPSRTPTPAASVMQRQRGLGLELSRLAGRAMNEKYSLAEAEGLATGSRDEREVQACSGGDAHDVPAAASRGLLLGSDHHAMRRAVATASAAATSIVDGTDACQRTSNGVGTITRARARS